MSEIPFVTRLGDALEAAAVAERRRPARRRRRPPRRGLVVVLAALVTVGGGAAIAKLVSDPAELAAASVSCYESPALRGGASVVWAGDRSPTEACEEVLRGPLVACDAGSEVAVFPGSGPRACERAGLRPLTAQYEVEQARVRALERAVVALERTSDCIDPREFASRVEALLRRSGWAGWRPWLRLEIKSGPCGSVSSYGGDGKRTIAGALDVPERRLMVFAGASPATEDLLYGRRALGTRLMDEAASRCHTQAELREVVDRRLAGSGRTVSVTSSAPEDGVTVEGAGGERLAAGCAVVVAVSPAKDGVNIDVQVWQRE